MKNYEYFLNRRIVNYVGWVGYGNLGDELLLDLIRREIEPKLPVHSLTYLNKAYRLRNYIPSFKQSIILGGGTLVFKETFYRRLMETRPDPLYLVGSGVCDVDFWCDYLRDNTVRRSLVSDWSKLLNDAKSISVRGDLSKKRLQESGVVSEIDVIGDPVFLACDHVKRREPDGATIGINFGLTKDLLWGKSDKKVASEFVKLVDYLVSQDHRVIIYSVNQADYNYAQSIVQEQLGSCNNVQIRLFENYLDFVLHVSKCSVFIGEKLHAVALALCGDVPSIMVSYRPKCEDLMSSLGLSNLTVRTDNLSLDRIRDLIDDINGNLGGYRKLISENSSRLCELQKNYIRNIVERIRQE